MSRNQASRVRRQGVEHYAPLSKAAVKRILEFDRAAGFGPGGTQPNRTRFYLYLTQRGSDVQIRTVAVKAPRKGQSRIAKEVVRASVDDPWMHILDLGFMPVAGYMVDWGPQGFSDRQWGYRGRWEPEAYALRCNWKINAQVINPELLGRTRRFRWHQWAPGRGHILDYLKVFGEHPEIELLAKAGLGRFSTRVSIVRRLKKDLRFRQWFMQNMETIKSDHIDVATILKAYANGISFSAAIQAIHARRLFRGLGLPRFIDAQKALEYIESQSGLYPRLYTDYLHRCARLGLNLADTKVSFPKQFKRRMQAVSDELDAIRAKKDAEERRRHAALLREAAEKFQAFENTSSRSFRIVIPRTVKELSAEGRAMKNCLGFGYAPRIARGDSLIAFVRRAENPRTAFVAVEYDLRSERVVQCYGANNSKPPKPVMKFVDQVFAGMASKKQIKAAA